jgi:uncharacterized protein (TIGR00369 family)
MAEERGFPLQRMLGFDLADTGPGRAVGTIEVRPELLNPYGTVHGGVICTLVDTVMGRAATSLLDPGEGCASVELHVRFLEPVTDGRLEAESEVIRRGRRLLHLGASVRDGAARLVATATATFTVVGEP